MSDIVEVNLRERKIVLCDAEGYSSFWPPCVYVNECDRQCSACPANHTNNPEHMNWKDTLDWWRSQENITVVTSDE